MGKHSCCMMTCKNTGKNSKCMFFRFPNTSLRRVGQREKWIAAVRSKNANGPAWVPRAEDRICNAHFIGGDRSLDERSSSYAPTIFSNISFSIKRIHRSQSNEVKRLNKKSMVSTKEGLILSSVEVQSQRKSIAEPIQNLTMSDVTMESEIEINTSLPVNQSEISCSDYNYYGLCVQNVFSEDDGNLSVTSTREFEKNVVNQECQSDESIETTEYVDNEIGVHASFMVAHNNQKASADQIFQQEVIVDNLESESDMPLGPYLSNDVESEKNTVDQACQATIFLNQNKLEPYSLFYISREKYQSGLCDVEIQTDICINNREIRSVHKKYKDKACSTINPVLIDTSVGLNTEIGEHNHDMCFRGFDSIKNEKQLLDLAGVSFETFGLLFTRIGRLEGKNWKIGKKDRLLIFLTKIKSGVTYSAISAIFCVSRSTVSRIFLGILEHLVQATQDIVLWPKRELVQATMPECFKALYGKTRVIIDCTEFRIETPANIDHRVWCYSNYKHGFTGRVLIGITPGGFISFKSKVAGGRKSDSQITIDSGLLKLLEEGDIVLADKGFPEIKTMVDDSGKDILIVMPPFLKDKAEFTTQETEDTYNIASVRIHVERIMQRLRIHKILDKIPQHLFKYVDDIVHICCVLVNLQPPIFAPSEVAEEASS